MLRPTPDDLQRTSASSASRTSSLCCVGEDSTDVWIQLSVDCIYVEHKGVAASLSRNDSVMMHRDAALPQ